MTSDRVLSIPLMGEEDLNSPLLHLDKPIDDKTPINYKPKIVIGISSYVEVDIRFMLQTLGLVSSLPIIAGVIVDTQKPIDHSRNAIVEKFLIDYPYATHLLFLDTDVLLPPRAIEQLLSLNQPIISGLIVQKMPPFYPLINVRIAPDTYRFAISWKDNEVIECDAIGMGCTLIRRDVFQKTESPWFRFTKQCIVPGQIVLGDNKAIELYKVGDKVLTIGGKSTVIDTFRKQYSGNIIDIRTSTIRTHIRTTPEHHILIKRQRSSVAEWVRAEQVNKGDYLAVPIPNVINDRNSIDVKQYVSELSEIDGYLYDAKLATCQRCGYKWLPYKASPLRCARCGTQYYDKPYKQVDKVRRRIKYQPKAYIPRAISRLPQQLPITDELLYLLGLYVAEGSAGSTFSFGMSDKELAYAQEVIKILKTWGVKARIEKREKTNTYGVRFTNKPLRKLLLTWFGSNAHNKHIPDWIIELPPNKLKHFIRGLWDGDGCTTLQNNKRIASFHTVSKILALQTTLCLLKLGFKPNYGEFISKNTSPKSFETVRNKRLLYYRVDIIPSEYYKFAETFNYPNDHISHPKWTTDYCSFIEDGAMWVRVKDISTSPYEGWVYDLTIAPNNQYCLEGVIVHNSEDYYFCEKIQDAGYKILVDTSVQCGHIGTYIYSLRDFGQFQRDEIAKSQVMGGIPKLQREEEKK